MLKTDASSSLTGYPVQIVYNLLAERVESGSIDAAIQGATTDPLFRRIDDIPTRRLFRRFRRDAGDIDMFDASIRQMFWVTGD